MLTVIIPRAPDCYDYALVGSPELEGIDGAIEKWEMVVAFLTAYPNCRLDDGGSMTCSLCHDYSCKGCPIASYVGNTNCNGTPYYRWYSQHDLESAQAELDFLYEVADANTG